MYGGNAHKQTNPVFLSPGKVLDAAEENEMVMRQLKQMKRKYYRNNTACITSACVCMSNFVLNPNLLVCDCN